MLPDTAIQEELSKAYIQAVASYAGYTVEHINRDNDGVDSVIKSNGKPAEDSILTSVSVEVQLKSCCSEEHVFENEDGNIVYDLKARNYNFLVDSNRQLDIILILLYLPSDKQDWISHSIDELIVRKCAYWVSLKGLDKTNNNGTKRITIPKDNVFSPDALHQIMVKVSKEEAL